MSPREHHKMLCLQRQIHNSLKFPPTASSAHTRCEEAGCYLRAEVTRRIFAFIDDVKFFMDSQAGVIHVRSASRTGYSDLHINTKQGRTRHEGHSAGRILRNRSSPHQVHSFLSFTTHSHCKGLCQCHPFATMRFARYSSHVSNSRRSDAT